MPRPKAVDTIQVGACAQCGAGTRAPNWTPAEIDRYVELLEESLPQLTKLDSAWQPLADALNEQYTERKPRCAHQLQKKYMELNAKFKTLAKKCTGGTDTPPWYTGFCRVKDKERSVTIPCLPPEGPPAAATAAAVKTEGDAVAKPQAAGGGKSPVTVKVEGGAPAGATAAQLRAQAMRVAAQDRSERRRAEAAQAKRAQEAMLTWAEAQRNAPKTMKTACRTCTACGFVELLPSLRQFAPSADPECTHAKQWKIQSIAVPVEQPVVRRRLPSRSTARTVTTPITPATTGTRISGVTADTADASDSSESDDSLGPGPAVAMDFGEA